MVGLVCITLPHTSPSSLLLTGLSAIQCLLFGSPPTLYYLLFEQCDYWLCHWRSISILHPDSWTKKGPHATPQTAFPSSLPPHHKSVAVHSSVRARKCSRPTLNKQNNSAHNSSFINWYTIHYPLEFVSIRRYSKRLNSTTNLLQHHHAWSLVHYRKSSSSGAITWPLTEHPSSLSLYNIMGVQ